MPKSKLRPAQTTAPDEEILRGWAFGKSADTIATELCLTPAYVKTAVDRALEASSAEFAASANKFRALQLFRLDRFLYPIATRALGGDLDALHACLKIMDQQNKIAGLYTVKHEHTGAGGDAITVQVPKSIDEFMKLYRQATCDT